MASDLISKRMMLRTLWEAWSDSTPHIMLFNGKLQCSQRSKDIQTLMNFVEKYPTVDAVEVVHGEWLQMEFWPNGGTWRCSECGRQIMFLEGTPITEEMHYCPKCSAKMDGGDKE